MHYSEILTEIENMTHIVKRLEEENKINVYLKLQIIKGNSDNLQRFNLHLLRSLQDLQGIWTNYPTDTLHDPTIEITIIR